MDSFSAPNPYLKKWGGRRHALIAPPPSRLRFRLRLPADAALELSPGIESPGHLRAAAGVHGIFALGTTGEFTSLSPEERRAFAALAVRAARGRVPVLIGCGSSWTDEAIAYARHAQEAGASGVVAVLPYYWLPSERSIYEHFRLLAEGVALPVYIYNFPALIICGE